MKYTVKDLRRDFPDDDSCLQWLVEWLHPGGITCKKCDKVTKHYKDKGRRSYSCSECGNHLHPTAGTICHNSRVPLTDWFYAIYMMSTNKAGTTATQIQRELGCTYKTAWRMMHQIRKMMASPTGLLIGEVEIDESYVHPNVYKRSSAQRRYGRTGNRTGQILFGMVQRNGVAKVWHVKSAGARVLKPLIQDNVEYGTLIHTDGYRAYQSLPKMGYEHRWTDHSAWEFYTDASYTQNIENLWSTMKPRWKGTFKHISPKYLQAYVDEFTWRYNHRDSISMFFALLGQFSEERSVSESKETVS
jgi:transposase